MSDSSKTPSNTAEPAVAESGLDRRGFLKLSSAAGAVAVAAPTLAKAETADRKQYARTPKRSAKDHKGGWFVV